MWQLSLHVLSGLSWSGQPCPGTQTPAPLRWASILGTRGINSINSLSRLHIAKQSFWSTSLESQQANDEFTSVASKDSIVTSSHLELVIKII